MKFFVIDLKVVNKYSENKNQINLNQFFKNIYFKKQCIKQLENKITTLNNIKKKNYKVLNYQLFKIYNNLTIKKTSKIIYLLEFTFSKKNFRLHVIDCSGNIKYFYSAGLLNFKGKQKIFPPAAILKKFYKILISDLSALIKKFTPIAIHFKNKSLKFNISWFLKKLNKKFFIRIVKFFISYPYNGCRKKKPKRKKFKTKKQEDIAERFKAVDCKSIK